VPPAVRAASAEPDSISRLEASTDSPSDAAGAKLRAAAADGKIDEIQALLDQGVPVDAPDIDGNTALMVSIKADRAAAAALLYQNGANLDLKNRAGLCARDMAKAENNININQAIGLVHRK
jgi:ankyrin repeat protein